ncbi:MAG: hypothetical protein CGU28_11350 [Candidatus Dactylopiibacterium carminicum]|uniref:Uncharacterized protein n=1 Tax=Candidatus Dactylopiibacterium carminicum TaxID=857335 RepID=A0A272EQH8_9RHOO|nr:hypothetical protein [Candidatus Dactylopiibacterium carminicum]KAF7598612.1 hypothetical protein BGI27_12405 [Candidatus Dactylopiibacterium carminicum]PAS92365.1 MAG: hypothetical protein CGU29_11960 [Candidatus Dactylopiibacterium carminicum]PAS95811.1 MAG: hypothetical protein CGU28_11350 [Candidatus Dactylopiibacterium carminicum]PAS98377.1 MAG: hypothetical protein BSR46_12420 [Candidatus Dactylopiibacterium carminicum]
MEAAQAPYKGFLIEALVYLAAPPEGKTGLRPLDKRYAASVRITNVETNESRISRLPRRKDFACVGDARRAAEIHSRKLIDSPPAPRKPRARPHKGDEAPPAS